MKTTKLANRGPPDYHAGMEFDDLTEAEKLFFEASMGNIDPSLSDEDRKARWDKFSDASKREISTGG